MVGAFLALTAIGIFSRLFGHPSGVVLLPLGLVFMAGCALLGALIGKGRLPPSARFSETHGVDQLDRRFFLSAECRDADLRTKGTEHAGDPPARQMRWRRDFSLVQAVILPCRRADARVDVVPLKTRGSARPCAPPPKYPERLLDGISWDRWSA